LDLRNEKEVDLLVVPIEVSVDVIATTGATMTVMMVVAAIMTATTVMNVLVMMIAMHPAVEATAPAGRIITMIRAVK
jgi:hypothetical protein